MGRQPARAALCEPAGGLEGGAALICVTPADLGKPIVAIVQRCGLPLAAGSSATGNHLSFGAAAAATDVVFDADGARVLALDLRADAPATVSLTVGAHTFAFAFGVTTLGAMQAQLSDVADVAGTTWAAYRMSTGLTVVAQCDPRTGTLQRLVLGRTETLHRLDVLPAPIDAAPLDYSPPQLRGAVRPQAPAAAAVRGTLVRIDVDRYGIARHVSVIVPSADHVFDAALVAQLNDAAFEPASLAGRAVAGSDFVLVRH